MIIRFPFIHFIPLKSSFTYSFLIRFPSSHLYPSFYNSPWTIPPTNIHSLLGDNIHFRGIYFSLSQGNGSSNNRFNSHRIYIHVLKSIESITTELSLLSCYNIQCVHDSSFHLLIYTFSFTFPYNAINVHQCFQQLPHQPFVCSNG